MLRIILSFIVCFIASTFSFSQTISNVSPNSGTQGTLSLPITITGSGTNFTTATSTLVQIIGNNGSSLQVLSINSVTPTSVSVDIAVPNTAFVGGHTVKVYDQSVGNFISLTNGFTVIANSTPPTLVGTTPEKAAVGQVLPVTISVDNANFSQATDNTMILMQQGTSTVLYPVPGTLVALNGHHLRAMFDFSGSTITSGSVFNSSCWNSLDGSFLDPAAIVITDPSSIAGNILYAGTYSGVVELYQKNTAASPNTYSLVSSSLVSGSNGYQFGNVAQASYLIRSVPVGMTDVVATYYPADISWQTATLLTTSFLPSTSINITPVTSISLPGGTIVNGAIGYGPNGFNKAAAIVLAEGIEVFLRDTDNNWFAQTVTDANGEYSFVGVGTGNYEIVIDIPGYLQTSTYNFSVSSISSDQIGLDFLIDDNMIFTTNLLELDAPQLAKLSLYPNPTNGELNIELPINLENAKLLIFDQMGQVVLEETLNTTNGKLFTTNINHLTSGVYVVRLLDNNNTSESRLIKR